MLLNPRQSSPVAVLSLSRLGERASEKKVPICPDS
jgi:hypothetical protein